MLFTSFNNHVVISIDAKRKGNNELLSIAEVYSEHLGMNYANLKKVKTLVSSIKKMTMNLKDDGDIEWFKSNNGQSDRYMVKVEGLTYEVEPDRFILLYEDGSVTMDKRYDRAQVTSNAGQSQRAIGKSQRKLKQIA